jgi:FAD/FMN-containing dehydrogenase
MSGDLLQTLSDAVGAANVLLDGDRSAYEVDWRKRYHGRALAVVRPGSTDEVAAVLRACARAGAAVVTQGGNTGLVGGGVPDASGTQVLLNLGRLNRIRGLDADNLTVTVEAGCVLQTLQESAAAQGFLFPLSLASEGSCTIGGNLAANAGGTQVLRYGNARELCLGLEVVTAQGEVWDGLSGLRKDNTGYDLRDLFIGSEGTLGVITAATLKLYPLPGATMTALASCPSIQACVELLRRARQRLDAGLTGFEVMERFSLELVARHFPQLPRPLAPAPWTVLLELAGPDESAARESLEALLGEALESGVVEDAAVAASLAQSHALWHLRESIPLAQAEEGLNIKNDIALPVSEVAGFVDAMEAELRAAVPGLRLVTFGHLGDGNLHYNLQAPEGIDAAGFLREHEHALNQRVNDAVMARGGSFSAEHGIGALKVGELARRKSPVALRLMRAIKGALDPDNRLNPGRVLG